MLSEELILIVFGAVLGAVLGFLASVATSCWQQRVERQQRRERVKRLFLALTKEIEEGIHRCEGIAADLERGRESFSRIHVALWDAAKSELAQTAESIDRLVLAHAIYYRFDLINFNMERGAFGVGAAFARDYLGEMRENFARLTSQ